MPDADLSPKYSKSHALIIGINAYRHVSPLHYARNDAEEVAALLISEFNFQKEDVFILLDEDATAANIRKRFCDFTQLSTDPNDRLLIFFAGHGHTMPGYRGDVGFLVPQDGDIDDLTSLVRWDELTRNADLIAAKHMLFIMDACYGGLALQRGGLAPGSTRFLKDMLLRRTRQVLTAGKADEPVGDAGGPLPGHSIFTGHFIEGLRGKAATPDGIITANSIMAYVYRMVAADADSHQTPHYGFLDGDGDFIFKADALATLTNEGQSDQDIMVAIPAAYLEKEPPQPPLMDRVKDFLSEPRHKIKLHDLAAAEVRLYLAETSSELFRTENVPWNTEEFMKRLGAYEQCSANLRQLCAAIAHWGDAEQVKLLSMILGRVAEGSQSRSGLNVWIELRWYPVILMTYCAGIGALSRDSYDTLAVIMKSQLPSSQNIYEQDDLRIEIGNHILGIVRAEMFKQIPGHERQYVPLSEYIHKLLQPELDDLLFLGAEYERFFDRFEVLLALIHADYHLTRYERVWGPVGRFGWKHRPLQMVIEEAAREKESWGPLRVGFFERSYERFEHVAKEYAGMVGRLGYM